VERAIIVEEGMRNFSYRIYGQQMISGGNILGNLV